MFGLFKNKEENNTPDWLPMVQETESRWFNFLEKLEVKAEELCNEAIPAIKEMANDDTDVQKRNLYKIMSGINGQLRNIRDKAYTAYDEKILSVHYQLKDEVSVTSPLHDIISDFRNRCSDRWNNDFQNKLRYWEEKIEQAGAEDYEKSYEKILAEYESIKNKFTCRQCGSPITIDKIFFISTYIACPGCQTQNTFEPSTQARNMEFLSMRLAEQRTAHLQEAYNQKVQSERDLYYQKHKVHISAIFEKNKTLKAQQEQQEKDLEAQREQAIADAPGLYFIYLRAKYDEVSKIIPDLKEHHEVRYQNELESFKSRH